MKKRTVKDIGLDKSHADYLTGMAQQVHAPTPFDDEVQAEYDKLQAAKKPKKVARP